MPHVADSVVEGSVVSRSGDARLACVCRQIRDRWSRGCGVLGRYVGDSDCDLGCHRLLLE